MFLVSCNSLLIFIQNTNLTIYITTFFILKVNKKIMVQRENISKKVIFLLTNNILNAIIFFVHKKRARVAEQADAQDLKSCGLITRTGSIPVSRTISTKALRYHCLGAFFMQKSFQHLLLSFAYSVTANERISSSHFFVHFCMLFQ